MPRARAQLCVVIVACTAVCAQSHRTGKTSTPRRGDIEAVVVTGSDSGPIVTISSSHPVQPTLQVVEAPLRLVIDVPGSLSSTVRKRIPFRNEQIKGVRVDQNQSDPPVTRIVVDLAGPVRYTWDALGNRLNIRLRPDETATAKPASVPAFTAGEQPVAVPYAEGSGGTLVEAGSRVASGSSITAKEDTAILRLSRGGEVRVCPGTTVSVTTSSAGNDLLLGMSTGAMETHYRLEESSDSVLTPDFRVVLPGPGEFDFAISADSHGNTCVASLHGTSASAVIAELLGSGTYEIKPNQQVMFPKGRLDQIQAADGNCGCPPRQVPVLRAANDSAPVIPESKAGNKLQLQNTAAGTGDTPGQGLAGGSYGAGDSKERDLKVQLEAPLVFSGRERQKPAATVPTAQVQEAAALRFETRHADPLPAEVVLPPAQAKIKSKGFFGHLKRLFGL